LKISKHLYYAYASHCGYDRYSVSLYQSHYHYLVINLALRYGLSYGDFNDDGSPKKTLLTILCRLFNESIVHRKKSLIEKMKQFEKTKKMIISGAYSPNEYLTIGRRR